MERDEVALGKEDPDLNGRAAGRHRLSSRLFGLEVGRGIAAVLVLLAHIAAIMAQPRFYGASPWGGMFGKFGAGVDFFFVLSGFIIAWVHWDDIGHPARLGRYAERRFRRIYPPYWGVLLPLSCAYFLFPGAGEPGQHDPANFIASFLLLPYPEHPILGVAWTLVYEIVFYVLFGLLIGFGRAFIWLLGAWGVAVLAANLAFHRLAYPFTILLDVRNLQFLMGVLTAWWVRDGAVPAPRLMTMVGAGLFVAQLFVSTPALDDPLGGRLGFGVAAVLAIAGVVAWERAGRFRVAYPLRLLGASSYSIYLVHGVAISAAIHPVIRAFPRGLSPAGPVIALVLAGVAAGIAYHLAVERPLIHWAGRGRRSAKADPHPVEGAGLVR